MAAKHGKRFRAAYEKIDRTHHYEPAEAVALLKQTATARFDETVEVHIRLGVNVRHADEQLRGTLALPNGAGRDVTVAVFAEGDKAREATEAGAEFVGSDDLAERIEAGWTDFDLVIATPDQMPKVGRLGRVLGPQGKMPNPKVGTVTDDVTKAVTETKSGKIEYRTDRQAVVHLSIGKVSFTEQALLENYAAVIDEIVRAKPAAAKGRYIISITLASTMGPGIRVDSSRTREAEILAGGETAGIPYAAWIADRLALPMQYIRKKPKGFGRNAQIEGDLHDNGRALLVEDLATDGRSKVNFCNALRDAGQRCDHAFVFFFYDIFPSAREDLAKLGIKLHALCTWWDVLEAARACNYMEPAKLAEVEKFLHHPAEWSAAHGGISEFKAAG